LMFAVMPLILGVLLILVGALASEETIAKLLSTYSPF
jgi:hypothetical protein